jgi:Fic family protein
MLQVSSRLEESACRGVEFFLQVLEILGATLKVPARPPTWDAAFLRAVETLSMAELWSNPLDDSEYLPWDRLRFDTSPEGIDHELWWVMIKLRRANQQRELPLRQMNDDPFHLALTDSVLRQCEEITRSSSGEIALPELATSQGDRDRYVVNSLIEEAITSSQLEGATTSRRVAKDLIRSGRKPSTRSEQMILNNYRAMEQVRLWRDDPMSPERVLELHRIVTHGTLDDPGEAGRLQTKSDERIAVWGDDDQLLHRPPDASELPARLRALCAFANSDNAKGAYLPVPVRAIVVHFMAGYDHYFADGNGRTARLLFYWCMLRNGYWLSEYVTISKILKNAPAQYARSYLLSEQDDGDLTYFVLYHLRVFLRGLADLRKYLAAKALELRSIRDALNTQHLDLNHRQLALLDAAARDPAAQFTVRSHGSSHRVSHESARQDLMDLETRGMLRRSKVGKAYVWRPTPDLTAKLGTPTTRR